MEKSEIVPFGNWPLWVKIITIPMKNRIKPEKYIGHVITVLLIISFYLLWKQSVIKETIDEYYLVLILFINSLILTLWQSLATMWINNNSNWELIKVSIIRRILTGLLILIIFIVIPIILTSL